MGFWKTTRKIVGHVIDIRVDRWVDFEYHKKTLRYLRDEWKRLFSHQKPTRSEEFDEAVQRLSLTPDDLATQTQRFRYLAWLFIVLSLALLAYACVIGSNGNWTGTIISVSIAFYALTLAFRFHFWYFQMSQRKLGCTVQEWMRSLSPIKRTKSL